ncbi:hypothetical protein E2C01_091317 [Portunus trituberculatus]|uniref:Uncharacterized protein n=1 Tax=Portunus trituberculatus TaxID=210409 RepID=A0A5B7JH64_PORTR|nr:hypothetical protein [Portunus trituberculatus]
MSVWSRVTSLLRAHIKLKHTMGEHSLFHLGIQEKLNTFSKHTDHPTLTPSVSGNVSIFILLTILVILYSFRNSCRGLR